MPRKSRPEPKLAVSFLTTAASLVGDSRNESHGDMLANFRSIAVLWNAYDEARRLNGHTGPQTACDAATKMELLKIARRLSGCHNPDDYIDAAGYAGVAGELSLRISEGEQ